jgi:hypothetical protein
VASGTAASPWPLQGGRFDVLVFFLTFLSPLPAWALSGTFESKAIQSHRPQPPSSRWSTMWSRKEEVLMLFLHRSFISSQHVSSSCVLLSHQHPDRLFGTRQLRSIPAAANCMCSIWPRLVLICESIVEISPDVVLLRAHYIGRVRGQPSARYSFCHFTIASEARPSCP